VGALGSISHSGHLAVALVAPAGPYLTVGIDLELSELPLEGAHLVLSAKELSWLNAVGPAGRGARLQAAFSAKETAFKALHPLLSRGLAGIRQITLVPDGEGFLCWARNHPSPLLRVVVTRIGCAVLTWTAPTVKRTPLSRLIVDRPTRSEECHG
jgi:hypothetical protein